MIRFATRCNFGGRNILSEKAASLPGKTRRVGLGSFEPLLLAVGPPNPLSYDRHLVPPSIEASSKQS